MQESWVRNQNGWNKDFKLGQDLTLIYEPIPFCDTCSYSWEISVSPEVVPNSPFTSVPISGGVQLHHDILSHYALCHHQMVNYCMVMQSALLWKSGRDVLAYSDTRHSVTMSAIIKVCILLEKSLCLEWQSGYNDTFPLSRRLHCKQGSLYTQRKQNAQVRPRLGTRFIYHPEISYHYTMAGIKN